MNNDLILFVFNFDQRELSNNFFNQIHEWPSFVQALPPIFCQMAGKQVLLGASHLSQQFSFHLIPIRLYPLRICPCMWISRLLWNILEYSKMLWNILKYSRMLWNILDYHLIFCNIYEYSGLFYYFCRKSQGCRHIGFVLMTTTAV